MKNCIFLLFSYVVNTDDGFIVLWYRPLFTLCSIWCPLILDNPIYHCDHKVEEIELVALVFVISVHFIVYLFTSTFMPLVRCVSSSFKMYEYAYMFFSIFQRIFVTHYLLPLIEKPL